MASPEYTIESINEARKALKDLSERLGSLALAIKESSKGDWDVQRLQDLEKLGYRVTDEVHAANLELDAIL